jgi:hypothetical protein
MKNIKKIDKKFDEEDVKYFYKNKLDEYFKPTTYKYKYSAFYSVTENEEQYPPEIDDLVRLHKLVRSRKVFNVLEFGLGYSTFIIADALMKNEKEYDGYCTSESSGWGIRRKNPFLVSCIDNNQKWIEITKSKIPRKLKKYIKLYYSECIAELYNGQLSHGFVHLPNDSIPDFIYLDGPGNELILGQEIGLDFKDNPEMTVMSNDLLKIENLLIPGAYILVDGRTNNARFLLNNFKRKWEYAHIGDTHHFELIESPLGVFNEQMLNYCLGDEAKKYNHLHKSLEGESQTNIN